MIKLFILVKPAGKKKRPEGRFLCQVFFANFFKNKILL